MAGHDSNVTLPSKFGRSFSGLTRLRAKLGGVAAPEARQRNRPLAAIERLPYELLDQIFAHLGPVWQTSLLCSSIHIWNSHATRVAVTMTHKVAIEEFLDRNHPPDEAFCCDCKRLRTWRTDGYGSKCPHSMGRVFPYGWSWRTRLNCIQQSISISNVPPAWISFLQYRVLLRNLVLYPNPAFVPERDLDLDSPVFKGPDRSASFKACNAGLCVKASKVHRMFYPDVQFVNGTVQISTPYAPRHFCTGKYVDAYGFSAMQRNLMAQLNSLFQRLSRFKEASHLYRCDWCTSEVYLRVTSRNTPSSHNELMNESKCAVIEIDEYRWLGAAMRPSELPLNQLGPDPGITSADLVDFRCMRDCFTLPSGGKPGLHLDLPCLGERPTQVRRH